MTIPAGLAGKYLVIGLVEWTGGSGGPNNRYTAIAKNGTRTSNVNVPGSQLAAFNASGVGMPLVEVLDLVATDYVEIQGYQDTGSPLTIFSAFLTIIKLDSGRVGTGVGCALYHSANKALGTGGEANFTMDSELFDTDGFHDPVTNSQRVTVPAGLGGKYLVTGSIHISSTPGGTVNGYVVVRKNGSSIVALAEFVWDGSSHGSANFAAVVDLAATDYLEVKTLAASAATVTGTSSWAPLISVMRIDSVPEANTPTYATAQNATTQTLSSGTTTLVSLTATLPKGTYVVEGDFYVNTAGTGAVRLNSANLGDLPISPGSASTADRDARNAGFFSLRAIYVSTGIADTLSLKFYWESGTAVFGLSNDRRWARNIMVYQIGA